MIFMSIQKLLHESRRGFNESMGHSETAPQDHFNSVEANEKWIQAYKVESHTIETVLDKDRKNLPIFTFLGTATRTKIEISSQENHKNGGSSRCKYNFSVLNLKK